MNSTIVDNQAIPLRQKVREIFLSIAISVYLGMTLLYLSPDTNARTILLKPFREAWLFCGFEQSWSLFSPSVRDLNFYPSSIITFQDGTKAVWEPYRMDTLNAIGQLRYEKYRKWSIDTLPWKPFANFWPDTARYVASLYYDPNNKPVSFTLNLHYAHTQPPVEPVHAHRALPHRDGFNNMFSYKYTEDDLKGLSK